MVVTVAVGGLLLKAAIQSPPAPPPGDASPFLPKPVSCPVLMLAPTHLNQWKLELLLLFNNSASIGHLLWAVHWAGCRAMSNKNPTSNIPLL